MLNLFAEIKSTDATAVREAREWAVAHGIDVTGCDAGIERTHSAHELMCASADALIELALVGQLMHIDSLHDYGAADDGLRGLLIALRDTSGGAARLLARSLEVHARDVGYRDTAWLELADDVTREIVTVSGLRDPSKGHMPSAIARGASVELLEALTLSINDRMAVPEHLAAALGDVVALFMLACTLLEEAE